MEVRIISLLVLLLVLAGCGTQKAPEPAGVLQQSAPAEDTTETSVQNDRISEGSTFRIKEDTMTALDGDAAPITGTKLSGGNTGGDLSERFKAAEAANGIFPSYGAITLLFEEETPLQLTWYIDDGYGFADKGTVITGSQSRTTFYLGANYAKMLSSDLENPPYRKLRIVCQYLGRSVEYLMLIDSGTLIDAG